MEALFSVAYTLKFMVKKGDQQIDYGVMPLEGLWWVDDMELFDATSKDDWQWTAMIMQPEIIRPALFEEARYGCRARILPPIAPSLPLADHLDAVLVTRICVVADGRQGVSLEDEQGRRIDPADAVDVQQVVLHLAVEDCAGRSQGGTAGGRQAETRVAVVVLHVRNRT